MKKYLLILTLVTFIVPSVAFASWWNPTSWGIFSFFFHTDQPTVIGTTTQIITESTAYVSSTTDKAVVGQPNEKYTPTPKIEKLTKNIVPVTKTQPTAVQTQAQSPVQPEGMFCNGTYWSNCSTGQQLICPQTGNAYCQVLAPVAIPMEKTGYQVCGELYSNATWDGTYVSSGDFNCVCKKGYEIDSNGTSCVLTQVQSIYQTAPSQDLSINRTVCDKATSNLYKFQESYAYSLSSIQNSSVAANIAQARASIFANQYNTALPGYQMAAEAACKIPNSNSKCQDILQEFDTFQSQKKLNPEYTSGSGQTFGNTQAMQLGNYNSKIYYSCI